MSFDCWSKPTQVGCRPQRRETPAATLSLQLHQLHADPVQTGTKAGRRSTRPCMACWPMLPRKTARAKHVALPPVNPSQTRRKTAMKFAHPSVGDFPASCRFYSTLFAAPPHQTRRPAAGGTRTPSRNRRYIHDDGRIGGRFRGAQFISTALAAHQKPRPEA